MIEHVINLPEADKQLKFIQLYIKGEPYLVCEDSHNFHSVILEKTLRNFNLKFEQIELSALLKIPKSKGENYELVGAGQIGGFKNKLQFYGNSSNYGLRTNAKHLEKIKSYLPTGIEVKILDF